MKFEMKKRILALALAGTTAFSVFGAAMSANAAYTVYYTGTPESTHDYSGDGYTYVPYVPAGNIQWGQQNVGAETLTIANACFVPADAKTDSTTGAYVLGTPVYVTPYVYQRMTTDEAEAYVTNVADSSTGILYYETEAEFADDFGYTIWTVDGATGNTPETVTYNNGTTTTTDDVTYVIVYSEETGEFKAFSTEDWGTGISGYRAVQTGRTYYVPKNELGSDDITILENCTSGNSENKALLQLVGNKDYFIGGDDRGSGAITNLGNYHASNENITVVTANSYNQGKLTTTAGYTSLDASNASYDATVEDVMSDPVANGVVYLYDYPDALDDVTVSQFARAWANESLVDLYNQTSGSISPELGMGSAYSVRRDVLDEWEAFIEDELGIRDYRNADSDYLTAWAEDTINNFAYQYYNDDVITDIDYNHKTGKLEVTYGGWVNLYNFDQLIANILEVATDGNYADHQTSEFVYLMQQYNKFVDGGYVDVNPVETDEWGDLLVSLLEAPTEDEFRTSAAYRKYTAAAADYIERYENAATSVAVTNAESAMYEFITEYHSEYRVADDAETGTLYASLDNTFFNTNWVGVGATYAGATEEDGILSDSLRSNSADYSHAWALYPADDYEGTVSGKNPGVAKAITEVTSEYYWFYNVYSLAYDIYTDAQFTSVADLAASALDEAVDALTPDKNAYASEILAAEEQGDELDALVETDYTTGMWGNKTKISTYITERVSNDEIGHVGSRNAATIAAETVDAMGRQRNQLAISKSEINSVKTAKSEAEDALEALRADEENYNAAQANALEKAIEDCDYIIDIYDGTYSKSAKTQSTNDKYDGNTGDKDQILKSDITDATQAVEDAINFSNIIMGWSQDKDGNWMYGTEEGYLNDGWHQVDGGKTWFYFNEDGTAKQSEWWQDGSTWYWFNSNCGAAVGWAKIDGDWYYFKGNNAMKTGWEKVEGSWYYMNSSGKMVTGWCQINGTWYYFSKESNALGQMLANTTTPDGYKVDANGALVE